MTLIKVMLAILLSGLSFGELLAEEKITKKDSQEILSYLASDELG